MFSRGRYALAVLVRSYVWVREPRLARLSMILYFAATAFSSPGARQARLPLLVQVQRPPCLACMRILSVMRWGLRDTCHFIYLLGWMQGLGRLGVTPLIPVRHSGLF